MTRAWILTTFWGCLRLQPPLVGLAVMLALGVLTLTPNAHPAGAADEVATWTRVADMSQPHYGFGSTLGLDGRIYAVAGANGPSGTGTVDVYAPWTNTWTTVRSGYPHEAAATGSDGRIYALG